MRQVRAMTTCDHKKARLLDDRDGKKTTIWWCPNCGGIRWFDEGGFLLPGLPHEARVPDVGEQVSKR